MCGNGVRRALKLIILAVLLLAFGNTACAEEDANQFPPFQIPAIYYGSIVAEDGKALESGIVKAYVDGEPCGSLPFTDGKYGVPADDPMVKRLLVYSSTKDLTGREVLFRVRLGIKEYHAASVPAKVIWETRSKQEVNLVVSSNPAPLSDLQGHWAEQNVQQLLHQGVISGYEDYTFRPENSITRAECAVLLGRALSMPDHDTETLAGFSDGKSVPAWAGGAVAAVVYSGLLKGYPGEDGSKAFRPDAPITRVELAALLARVVVQKLGAQPAAAMIFADRNLIPGWAEAEVGIAVQKELIKGYPDGTFKPDAEVTRAEAAAMIARLIDKI